jgi:tRNA pseudouridine55 synthase
MREPTSATSKGLYSGLLIVDKPAGMSSAQVVHRLRKILQEPRAGHTGTLDPLATGVLPICLGPSTKLAQFLSAQDKRYRAELTLGVETNTLDRMGEAVAITSDDAVEAISDEQIAAALDSFVGAQLQTPPMYSALKVDGRRLYKRALAGEVIDRLPRAVQIHSIALLARRGSLLEIDIHCSKGTYVRSLVDDIGKQLGVGAHLSELRRLSSGRFNVADALVEECWTPDQIASSLIPLEQMTGLPSSVVTDNVVARIRCGEPMDPGLVGIATDYQGRVQLLAPGAKRLLAVVYVSGQLIRYDRVFRD